MTTLKIPDLLLANLRQQLHSNQIGYMSPEDVCEILQKDTGLDFGYDIKAWAKWLKENGKKFYG